MLKTYLRNMDTSFLHRKKGFLIAVILYVYQMWEEGMIGVDIGVGVDSLIGNLPVLGF